MCAQKIGCKYTYHRVGQLQRLNCNEVSGRLMSMCLFALSEFSQNQNRCCLNTDLSGQTRRMGFALEVIMGIGFLIGMGIPRNPTGRGHELNASWNFE